MESTEELLRSRYLDKTDLASQQPQKCWTPPKLGKPRSREGQFGDASPMHVVRNPLDSRDGGSLEGKNGDQTLS